LDKVRALQHTLYRTAKADPGRRFHALWDKVCRRDVLWRGWVAVRANNGAPGIDRITLEQIEHEYGALRLVDELSAELQEGRYRPLPARGVLIPKPGRDEYRPLQISAVRDRVVQAALKIVLEPVFEADFLPCSFGFRPRRSAHDALQVVIDETWRGRRWVVETDIANCFSAIPQDRLVQAIEERVADQSVLKLIRQILRAGVMQQDGQVRRTVTGAAQGGPVSPLLCNVYLHRIDRAWDVREHGVLVRFADDALVLCKSACSRPDPGDHLSALDAAVAGGDRGEVECVPPRLGCVLQVRALSSAPQQDQTIRAVAAGPVHAPTPPPKYGIRLAGPAQLPAGRPRTDQLVWNHRRTQGGQALAGQAECRR
jgi:RNA-directed DNA polymerase